MGGRPEKMRFPPTGGINDAHYSWQLRADDSRRRTDATPAKNRKGRIVVTSGTVGTPFAGSFLRHGPGSELSLRESVASSSLTSISPSRERRQ
jgi:hypothetical protein